MVEMTRIGHPPLHILPMAEVRATNRGGLVGAEALVLVKEGEEVIGGTCSCTV
jgi:hypothetical protein